MGKDTMSQRLHACRPANSLVGVRMFKNRGCRHLIICKSCGLVATHYGTTGLPHHQANLSSGCPPAYCLLDGV